MLVGADTEWHNAEVPTGTPSDPAATSALHLCDARVRDRSNVGPTNGAATTTSAARAKALLTEAEGWLLALVKEVEGGSMTGAPE